MTREKGKQGFTLIELAIVLAIIALVVGGILGGQSLLHNAKLRDTQIKAENYIQAIKLFHDKYDALPGDMYNATTIWGARSTPTTAAACVDSNTYAKTTCDGNGNGYIGETSATGYEVFRAWQHLANASLISGRFTGSSLSSNATNPYDAKVKVNIPVAALNEGAGYNIRYENSGADGHFAESIPHHYLIIGLMDGSTYNNDPAFSTSDSHSIDNKVDDGLPGQGRVVTYDNTANSRCATTDVAATARYDRQRVEEESCVLHFRVDLE